MFTLITGLGPASKEGRHHSPRVVFLRPLSKTALRSLLFTRLVCAVLLLASGSSVEAVGLPEEYPGYTISTLTVRDLNSMEPEEFLYLLDLPEGTPVTREKIRNGIDRVFRTGNFLDVQVDVADIDKAEKGLTLVVSVRERVRISKVSIRGDYSVSKREIRRVLNLGRGDEYRADKVREYEHRVHRLLAERGFPKATVQISTAPTHRAKFVTLILQIDAGEGERIRDVKVTGSGNLSFVSSGLSLTVGDVFDRKVLSENLAEIVRDARGGGYYQAEMPDWSFTEAVLDIRFNSGPAYEVRFDGNRFASSRKLRKQFSFKSLEVPMTDDVLEEAARQYVTYYRKNGFPFAQVATSFVVEEERTLIVFYMYEGPRVVLRSLELAGVSLPDTKRLKEILQLEEGDYYDATAVDENLSDLISLYKSLGFLGVTVSDVKTDYSVEPGAVRVTVVLEEGPRTLVRSVSFSGNTAFPDENLLKWAALREGEPYNEVDAADARFRVIEEYSRTGYGGASVWVDARFTETMDAVDLVFEIVEGRQSVFGKTIIAGNARTRSKIIRKEFNLPEGAPFDYRQVLLGRQALHRMGLFQSIRAEPLERGGDGHDVDMLVSVREGSFGTIDLGIGYADYERLRGFVEVGHNNLNGLNRRLSLRFEASTLTRRGILGYRDPWLLSDYRLPLRVALLQEYVKKLDAESRDTRYESDRTSVVLGVERDFTEFLKGTLNYEYSYVDTYNVRPGEVLSRNDVGTLGISSLSPSLARDTRDNPFNPKSGSLTTLTVKVASNLFLSEVRFYKATVQGSVYQKIFGPLVGAVALRGGIGRGLGGIDDLPLVERFFLGGGKSVRGFAQDSLGPQSSDGDPTGGNAFVSASTELRTDLFWGVGLVLFIDGGNVWSRNNEVDMRDLRYAWGTGLRYETPVGPFRLDYGRKFDVKEGEDPDEIHFSLGHAF